MSISNQTTPFIKSEDGKWLVSVSRDIDIEYTRVEVALERIRDSSRDLIDPHIDLETYNDYGNPSYQVFIVGFRLATEQEIVEIEKVIAVKQQREEQQQMALKRVKDKEVANFIKNHPELEVRHKL